MTLVTRDGLVLKLRPVTNSDAQAVVKFFDSLTPDDMRFRFLSSDNHLLTEQLAAMVEVDHRHRKHLLSYDAASSRLVSSLMIVADEHMEVSERGPIAGSLLLDHGESGAIDELRRLADSKTLAPPILVPEIGEVYKLSAGKPARRSKTGRPELQQAIGRDWQNNYADLATSLKRRLGNIRDSKDRQRAIDEMRKVLDSYNVLREAGKGR